MQQEKSTTLTLLFWANIAALAMHVLDETAMADGLVVSFKGISGLVLESVILYSQCRLADSDLIFRFGVLRGHIQKAVFWVSAVPAYVFETVFVSSMCGLIDPTHVSL